MSDRVERRLLLGLIGLVIFGPVAVMMWNLRLGVVLLLLGLIVAYQGSRMLRALNAEGAVQDQQYLYSRRDRGRTIYVELVDDDGNELQPSVAEQRLAEARLNAGPRDTVIGVRRKLG